MSVLKDLLALADDKLHEVFTRKPHDPTKARAPILKGIEKTKTQFLATEPTKGKKWFKVNNSVVELTLPFSLNGSRTLYLPSERFVEFLDKLKGLVENGAVDKDIEAGQGDAPKAARAPSSGRQGWSDERRAKFKASVEARKAAKKK